MSDYDLVLRSRRVLTAQGERPAAVCVAGGRIAAIEAYDAVPGEDLGDLALLPGLVDTHVHVNEPGRTEWEGFVTATQAAAAGGVTTLIDMPLNSLPPTVSVAALAAKRAAAQGKTYVDVGFWGGAVPGNESDLAPLYDAGVFGFKSFLVDSGVPEFPPLDAAGLERAMSTVEALFIVHAESPAAIEVAPSSQRYADFVASRPPAAETEAVGWVIAAARRTGARAHILHLSSAASLPLIEAAKSDGVRITVETCPHYLCLEAEQVPDGATEFKCCPPIRDAANCDALWAGLAAGVIDFVVSDHSPCTPALKARDTGDFAAAWGGIASLQLGLPVMWTEAKARGHSLSDVVRWMAHQPAAVVGLTRKGRIEVGCDADLVAFAPDQTWTVDASTLRHRHPVTPYAGRSVTGMVREVWLAGEKILDGPPRGRQLSRGDT